VQVSSSIEILGSSFVASSVAHNSHIIIALMRDTITSRIFYKQWAAEDHGENNIPKAGMLSGIDVSFPIEIPNNTR
jgi:hypothetical protein